MNSTVSVSKSSDCPSSTPCFLLSGVFSEGEGASRLSMSCTKDKHVPLSGQCFPTHSNHASAKTDRECVCKSNHYDASTSTAAGSSHASPGDLAFAQKCADLQRFIRPLLELLHGLKSGRFDKGLTSFQQSVAIDRLQRILGILQKPDMGEKYLQNLLQIEVMLKMWFPQDALKSTSNQAKTPKRTYHWCQNQLHMPVKKRKLSWSDPDRYSEVSTKHKHLKQEKHAICEAVTSLDTVSTCLPELDQQNKGRTIERLGPSCAGRQDFTSNTSPLHLFMKENQMHRGMFPPSPATQDSSVSSSTATADSP